MLLNLALLINLRISEVKKDTIKLKKNALAAFLKDHHGKEVKNEFTSDYVHYYECDDNRVVIENTKAGMIWIEADRSAYYAEKRDVLKWQAFDPYGSKQQEIKSVGIDSHALILDLYEKLSIKPQDSIRMEDLATLDKAIKKYGYERAIESLYVNLIVFAGEFVKHYRGGQWILESVHNIPGEAMMKPVFVDSRHKNYDFDFNILLLRTFIEKRKFSIQKLIQSAVQLNAFPVEQSPQAKP